MSVSAEELEGLGEEERAALMDDETEETEEPEAEEPETEEDEADDDGGAEADDDSDDEPEQDEPSAEEPKQQPHDEPFVPEYKADPVADFDEQLKALNERKRELRTQYQDGDITLDEYEDQRDQVESEVLTLREANFKATIAQEQQQQINQQRWMWEVERFLAENAYIRDNRAAFRAVDALIIDLKSDPANQGKPNRWFLDEAKRQYEEAPRGASAQPVASKEPPKKPKKPVPPNLGDMPNAELPETGGNEWAHLDKLDGMELEAALAKLSQADQERYLRGE